MRASLRHHGLNIPTDEYILQHLNREPEAIALYQQVLVMEDRPRYDTYGLT